MHSEDGLTAVPSKLSDMLTLSKSGGGLDYVHHIGLFATKKVLIVFTKFSFLQPVNVSSPHTCLV